MSAPPTPAVTTGLTQLATQPVVVMAQCSPTGGPSCRSCGRGCTTASSTSPSRTGGSSRATCAGILALLSSRRVPTTRCFVVVEGEAELSPVSSSPGDDTAQWLADLYRALAGEHPDWDDYYEAMVRDERLVARIAVTHTYEGGSNA